MAYVTLDALISRADFCESHGERSQTSMLPSISLQNLGPESHLAPTLRKPDFQRETNHWKQDQVLTFLKSFLDNELVPSIIFWRSTGQTFVIDGAHRISALLAWINDDYGDGHISRQFYENQIKEEQIRVAERMRRLVNREVGSYKAVSELMKRPDGEYQDALQRARVDNARVRTIDLQWVEGNAEKAESSFFKINQQGTALDKTEERLLKLRRKPIAIASRAIIRAGSGHKYWSKFDENKKTRIEEVSSELHNLLFSPEIKFPIKTLNLPHGGKSSTISAYNLLMDMVAYVIDGENKESKESMLYQDDEDGDNTLRTLLQLRTVVLRMTGNTSGSLGLHPAVYFYSAAGNHWDAIFISMLRVIAKAVRNNDDDFFKLFTKNRKTLEALFLSNKALLAQANVVIGSKLRIDRWANLIEKTARGKLFENGVTQDEILEALEVTGRVFASEVAEASSGFSNSTKSAVFLSESIQRALKCPLCGGLIAAEKSVSYDHIRPRAKGGTGARTNAQMTHPYCNSLKGDS